MKTSVKKFIALNLLAAIFLALPQYLSAQNSVRLVGELVVTKNSPDASVTVNGEPAVGGRSITSPSDVRTSSAATAKLLLPQTGSVELAPDSKFNLSFVNSSIAGDFLGGVVTIETVPNTTLNIFTSDGMVTTPNRNQVNVVKVWVDKEGITRVTTVKGEALFNTVLVSAGETYNPPTAGKPASASGSSSGGVNPLLILGILGAVGGAVIIALAGSSGGGDNPVVSPTR